MPARQFTETKSWTAADVERAVDDLETAIETVVNDDTIDADVMMAKIDDLQGVADQVRSVVDGGSVDGATDDDTRLLGEQLNAIDQLIALAREKVAAMQSGKSRRIPGKSDVTPYDLSTPDAVAAALASADLGAELEPDEMAIVATFIADENPEISDVAELTRIYDAAVRRMLADVDGGKSQVPSEAKDVMGVLSMMSTLFAGAGMVSLATGKTIDDFFDWLYSLYDAQASLEGQIYDLELNLEAKREQLREIIDVTAQAEKAKADLENDSSADDVTKQSRLAA